MFGAINDSEDGGNLPKAKSSAISNVCFMAGFRLSSAGLPACDPYPEWKSSMRHRYENGCIMIGLCSLKLLGPLKASVLLIQSALSITTLKAISKGWNPSSGDGCRELVYVLSRCSSSMIPFY